MKLDLFAFFCESYHILKGKWKVCAPFKYYVKEKINKDKKLEVINS